MSRNVSTQDESPILLVEDNPAEVRLAKEAFDELDRDIPLTVATDGAAALAALRNECRRPALVILDLNLPDTNGDSILEQIKSDDRLKRTPVIVFTTSQERRDVDRMYDLHANAYVIKPDSVEAFMQTIEHVVSFWLTTATLPQSGR